MEMPIKKNIKKIIVEININFSLLEAMYLSREKTENVTVQQKYAEFFIPFQRSIIAIIIIQIGYLFDKDDRSAASFYGLKSDSKNKALIEGWKKDNKLSETIKNLRDKTIAHFDHTQGVEGSIIIGELKEFISKIDCLYKDIFEEKYIITHETGSYKNAFDRIIGALKQ